jgi:DNA-binding CsgD family transcriptional regulator
LRIEDAPRAIMHAKQANDLYLAYQIVNNLTVDHIEAGNVVAARRTLEEYGTIGVRSRIPYIELRTAVYHAMLELTVGNYTAAEPLIERVTDLWRSTIARQHQAQSIVLLRDLGRLDEFDGEVEIPTGVSLMRRPALAHQMLLLLETGRAPAAREYYEAFAADAFEGLPRDFSWLGILVLCAEATIVFEDRPRAERLIALLRPYADRCATIGGQGVCHGPVALALGRLATILENWDAAERHLETSLELCERNGLLPFAARTNLALAEVHLKHTVPHAREQARAFLDRADEVARRIGMAGLYDRIATVRDALTPQTDEQPLGLTARELDVLRLVADGKSNQEIGEELFISPRTVATHVANIMNKLTVSSRTAAARIAVENDLV